MRTVGIVAVSVFFGTFTGIGIGDTLQVIAHHNDKPREIVVTCVGEDSCNVPVLPKGWHADYRHNEWHITEGK
jgi:hypothetical protein